MLFLATLSGVTAMYRAKSLGGGRAEVFDAALGRQVQQRSTAHGCCSRPSTTTASCFTTNPSSTFRNGSVAGFEALARIAEHDGSILPPAAFIPVAEDSGLVVPLGAQVLAMACDEASGWQPAGLPERPMTVAVNLSSRQFEPGDLPAIVRATAGARPGSTRSACTSSSPRPRSWTSAPTSCSNSGASGTSGCRSASTTSAPATRRSPTSAACPLTFVKIDQSFVQGLGADQEDERIVAAVVDLGRQPRSAIHRRRRRDAEQLDRLRELGCDQAQGYLFARPLPPHDLQTVSASLTW